MKPGRLTRRAELARSASAQLRRSRPIRHKPRKRRPTELTQHEARLQTIFYAEKVRQGRCASCGYTGPFLEVHHAIAKQLLNRLLSKKGEPCPLDVIWSPDDALVLCSEPAPNRCHQRHELAVRRVPQSALRPENWAFARRHGLEWVLEAQYPDITTEAA